ncbi:MAG: hypothetical protein XD50_0294 [Clostridia bacterium 41_269]|nr:MAG: hypothetical protein XD50_0294 [Clostridia bacterium 41_269]
MLFALGLFVSVFFLFFFITARMHEYDIPPVLAAVDRVRAGINKRIASSRNAEMLNVIGKTAKEVTRKGILLASLLAFLSFALTVKFIGVFALLAAVFFFGIGILLTEKLIEGEFRRWQARVIENMPVLISFMPAFLEIEGITPREALSYSVGFLSDPLKSELESVIDKIKRTGKVKEAVDVLAKKAKHSLVDAVCFRLSAAWDAKVTADIFADLSDQVDNALEIAAARTTTMKTAYFALVCVISLIGVFLVFAYPGMKYLLSKISFSMGGM